MMGVRNVVLGVSKTAMLRQNVLSQSPRSSVSTIKNILVGLPINTVQRYEKIEFANEYFLS